MPDLWPTLNDDFFGLLGERCGFIAMEWKSLDEAARAEGSAALEMAAEKEGPIVGLGFGQGALELLSASAGAPDAFDAIFVVGMPPPLEAFGQQQLRSFARALAQDSEAGLAMMQHLLLSDEVRFTGAPCVDVLRTGLKQLDLERLPAALETLIQCSRAWPETLTPVRALFMDEDPVAPIEAASDWLNRHEVALESFPGGHACALEQPESLVAWVESWLASLTGSAG